MEEECDILRDNLNQCQKILNQNPSIEQVNAKIRNYDEMCDKLRHLLINEETKRGMTLKNNSFLWFIKILYQNLVQEKSYFIEFNQQQENKTESNENTCKLVYKAILNCLEDYQGEIKHSKMIMKEVSPTILEFFGTKFLLFCFKLQTSWESKENSLRQKELNLNNEFNKKFNFNVHLLVNSLFNGVYCQV